MKILVTGATGNIGRGMVPRLRAAGHELVLSDVPPQPEGEPFEGLAYHQLDIQAGVGLDRAVAGCDLVLHLPAWHGIHSGVRTEADFWRLNIDGTFWMFQAAAARGVKRVLFLSSQAWHAPYHKYGFTKRIGEELCEYYRRNHAIAYVAVRPQDLTPWTHFARHYGRRLLYDGVDREDVLDAIERSIAFLGGAEPGEDPPGFHVDALRARAFAPEQLAGWEDDPLAACEALFPGSRSLVEKYRIDIAARPKTVTHGPGNERVGYRPSRHFGTFLEALASLDREGGEALVDAQRCPFAPTSA